MRCSQHEAPFEAPFHKVPFPPREREEGQSLSVLACDKLKRGGGLFFLTFPLTPATDLVVVVEEEEEEEGPQRLPLMQGRGRGEEGGTAWETVSGSGGKATAWRPFQKGEKKIDDGG